MPLLSLTSRPLTMRTVALASLIATIALVTGACGSADTTADPASTTTTPAATPGAPADVPVDWVALTSAQLIDDAKLSPPAAARLYAYLTVAMNEGVAAAHPDADSLAGHLNGLDELASVDPDRQIDAQATVTAAAAELLTGLPRVGAGS